MVDNCDPVTCCDIIGSDTLTHSPGKGPLITQVIMDYVNRLVWIMIWNGDRGMGEKKGRMASGHDYFEGTAYSTEREHCDYNLQS